MTPYREVKVLVTGAAGFIGSHVTEALEAAGHEVVRLDLRTGDDVRDAATLDRLMAGVDVVVHQAAKVGLGVNVADLPDYASVNVYGTAVLLAAMARHEVGRLVLASSMVVYGEGAYNCPTHGPGTARAAFRRRLGTRALRTSLPSVRLGGGLRHHR
ncbi:NAD-dependent epimerase/dehydratase family protein [Nonomuraea sp. NPDC049625]|uniref:NAD-dependent epimerase/dehydratase family protein n=1 Tax=Nonomuraea sp. NPDC049625 TaxID=3155775 RepID=UPI0034297C33